MTENRIVTAEREITVPATQIFKLIADPARQPQWDGNDNLAHADQGQRIVKVGQTFTTELTNGQSRTNHVTEFEEGRLIAWKPAMVGEEPRGHVWRWELEPVDELSTLVRHTYDWTALTDETRIERARATTQESLQASLAKLAELSESLDSGAEVTD